VVLEDKTMADDINIFGLLRAVWKNKWLFLGLVFICSSLAVILALMATPRFTAYSTMLPFRSGPEKGMANRLAILSGMQISNATYEDLIKEILESNAVLDQVIFKNWRYLGEDNVSLFDVFKIDVADSTYADVRIRNVIRNKCLNVQRDQMTGFIKVSFTAPRDPELAADLTNEMVDAVMSFKSQFHETKASSNQEYLNRRLLEIQKELEDNEMTLAEFISNNRSYSTNPELLHVYNSMRRRVEASQGAWLEVRRQLEVALLESHKGPTEIEVLDKARPPALRSYPRRASMAIFGFLFGNFLALVTVFFKEFFNWSFLIRNFMPINHPES